MVAPAPSKKTVAELKASILQPSLTSTYECWFQPPSAVSTWLKNRRSAGLGDYTSSKDSLISLSCSEAVLPGSSLATHEINNDFSGVTERHAYRRQYDDRVSFTFYVDSNYEIIYFFENWIAFIVNEQRTDSLAFGPGMSKPNFSYRVRFPETYQQTIYINKFEKDHSGNYLTYSFVQAYPISIDSMPVSYDSSQLLKCTVSFTYSRYIITSKKSSSLTNDDIKRAVSAGVEAGYAAAASASQQGASNTAAASSRSISNQSSVNTGARTRNQVLTNNFIR